MQFPIYESYKNRSIMEKGFANDQFLADQLTLSQPGGGHIIPTQYYKPLRIFRPCDGPVYVIHFGKKSSTNIPFN